MKASTALLVTLIATGSWLSPAAADTVELHGSTTVMNAIVQPHKAEIEKLAGHALNIVGNGSGRGILDLLEGKTSVAMISAPLEVEVTKLNEKKPGSVDPAALKAHSLGESRVAFVVHPSNAVHALTDAQLADVLTGKISNWSQVGGSDQAIVIVAESPGGGIRSMVESALLKNGSLAAGTRALPQASQVAKVVSQLPGGIGISTPASIQGNPVAELKTEKPIAQPLLLVTKGEPSGAAKQIVDAVTAIAKGS